MEYMILEFYDQDNSCAGNVAWLDAYFDDDDCSYYNTVECDGGSYEYTCVSDLNDLDIDGMYPDGYSFFVRVSLLILTDILLGPVTQTILALLCLR